MARMNNLSYIFKEDIAEILNEELLYILDAIANQEYPEGSKPQEQVVVSKVINLYNDYIYALFLMACYNNFSSKHYDANELLKFFENQENNLNISLTNINFEYNKVINYLKAYLKESSFNYLKENPENFLALLENYCKIKYNEGIFQFLEIDNPIYPIRTQELRKQKQVIGREKPISISNLQNKIRDILFINNIPFQQEYIVDINGHKRKYDIAIFGKNGIKYLIEGDGEQHFKEVDYFGGELGFAQRKQADLDKNNWAKEHNIPLIRIPYFHYNNLNLLDLKIETSKFIV